jgi:hypothetical protein
MPLDIRNYEYKFAQVEGQVRNSDISRRHVVEAINGNLKTLLRRGRGYKNLRYLLLKAQQMAATRTEFVVFQKAA